MPRSNPFRPTFGASPRIWAGRRIILDDFSDALNADPGDASRSLIISGSRGIGKTVLLTELEDIAARNGWIVLRANGREETVDTLVNSTIPEKIHALNPPHKRRITGVTVAGVGAVNSQLDHSVSAPTPTLNSRLRELHSLLHGTGVLITVDEVQDAHPDSLAALAVAHQDLIRDDLDTAFIAAGLTHGVDALLDLPGTTFLRRARRFDLGPLTANDSATTLRDTADNSAHSFSPDGLAAAVDLAQGYPYLVQLVGSLAWAKAESEGKASIDDSTVSRTKDEAIAMMGTQVHHPSLKGVPPAQRAYLTAMAELEDAGSAAGHHSDGVATSEIATKLGKAPSATTDTRGKLIDRDLISPAGWGRVRFTLPYLAEYLRTGGSVTKVQ